ncbi:MAG: phospho-sugar mutase [Actinomycetota bacterium]|nr:phospho-sugar mutase [Actinomycetota bacterium]
MSTLHSVARAWAAQDPDDADRAEIERLLADPSPGAYAELKDCFAGRLHFGTAGLRGALGAGPNRMNRAVVRQTTAALARWLDEHRPEARRAGVVVGSDARHRSRELADEVGAVLAGHEIRVHRLPDRRPTPLLAFAVRHIGAAAGVMITASHNPPQDNGYKLYLGDGAQIVPPVDAEIEALSERVGPLSEVRVAGPSSPLLVRVGEDVPRAYLRAVVESIPEGLVPPQPLSVVYTAMHGVAGQLFLDALSLAGHPRPSVVAAQEAPDPDFPTVASPNPEEPGALDLAFAEARRIDADLVLASDPDGDRLAAAVPDTTAPGGWRRLSGDEVGVALGAFVLDHLRAGWRPPKDGGEPPVIAASIVSSSMLGKIAAASGVPYVATLTGFKWIVRAVDAFPGSRLAFGYEEALGYVIGDAVRDKDGILAGLAFLAMAGDLRARGTSVDAHLLALMRRYGVHRTSQHSIATHDPAGWMAGLRARPPTEIAGATVIRVVDLARGAVWQEGLPALPPADVLAFWLDTGARVLVRPSGTEPKLKFYVEAVHPVRKGDLAGALESASEELDVIAAALQPALLGRPPASGA